MIARGMRERADCTKCSLRSEVLPHPPLIPPPPAAENTAMEAAQHPLIRPRVSLLRRAAIATVALSFLPLAYVATQGQRQARRQAELEDMLFCRTRLQDALDAQRSDGSGPAPRRSTVDAQSSSRAVTEWAAKLKWRLANYGAASTPRSRAEDADVRLSTATLAIAERRLADALAAVNALVEPLAPSE